MNHIETLKRWRIALQIAENIHLAGAAYTVKAIGHGIHKIKDAGAELDQAIEQAEQVQPDKVAIMQRIVDKNTGFRREQAQPVAERFEAMHANGDVWITALAAAALARNTALDQAIAEAEQAQLVATGKEDLQVWVIPLGEGKGTFSWDQQDERFWTRMVPATVKQSLTVKQAEQAQQQEPVAWTQGNLVTVNQDSYPSLGGLFVQFWEGEEVAARVYGNDRETLNRRCAMFTPSPPSQPLTDEQIDAILDAPATAAYIISDGREKMRLFARAIEAAHGITKEESK